MTKMHGSSYSGNRSVTLGKDGQTPKRSRKIRIIESCFAIFKSAPQVVRGTMRGSTLRLREFANDCPGRET